MNAKTMKAISLVISCVLVVLAAAQVGFTALMVLAELQDQKCPTSVETSDLDFVREAWNAELAALSQPIATNDEAAQLIRSNADCCRVIHVGPRSLWTKLTSVTEGRSRRAPDHRDEPWAATPTINLHSATVANFQHSSCALFSPYPSLSPLRMVAYEKLFNQRGNIISKS